MDIYDIDGIVNEALRCGIDISPSPRDEWALWCCALKVLNFDEHTFRALSWQDSRTQKMCGVVWRAESHPQRYVTEESAKAKIAHFAKTAGMDLKPFLLSPYQDRQHSHHPDRRRAATAPRLTSAQVRPAAPPATSTTPRRYIKPGEVEAAAANYRETALYVWLCREFDNAAVDKVFNAYRVGGAEFRTDAGHRAVSFPYIGIDGRCVDCKIFHTDINTGSRKTAPPLYSWTDSNGVKKSSPFTWLLFQLMREAKRQGKIKRDATTQDYRAKWCNFGDHILRERPTDTVCIVESEKSALIASIVYPEKIWIAVGSMENLTEERFTQYRGRTVVVFPDRDGLEKWQGVVRHLAVAGYSMFIDTTTERHFPKYLTDENGNVLLDEDGNPKKCKADIADLILLYRHGEQPTPTPPPAPPQTQAPAKSENQLEAERIFERLKSENPVFADFAEKLQLEPISVEPYRCQNQNE